MLIFDIGSNRGQFTNACLADLSDCKIVMVEPNPGLIDTLNSVYGDNPSIVDILHAAASDRIGDSLEFRVCLTDNRMSTVSSFWLQDSRFSTENFDTPVSVDTTTLDWLVEKYGKPELIKIDVEGYEYEVIKGLSSKEGKLCFEWTEEQYDLINLSIEHLASLGYTQFGYVDSVRDGSSDYLREPDNYVSEWVDSSFHQLVEPSRKQKWGMIWVK
jgi:FkbM family methyltransferase